VTRFVETSVLVRYLTGEPPEMARRAEALIDSDQPLFITGVILAEAAHVLRTIQGLNRELIVDALIDLVQRTNIAVHHLDKPTVLAALLLCRPSNRISVPDALIWAEARRDGPTEVYSFDRRFPREGITLREP
jgi:predicted nucleic acid-binding protein